MGCDIHIITEIKRNNKWEYIPDVPQSLNCRNYSTFAALANVRNNFHIKGFEPKGLPEDMSAKQFCFESERANIEKRYETGTEQKIKLPDGSYIDKYDPRVKKTVSSREEAETYGAWSCCSGVYTVIDISLVNGEYVDIPIKELYTKDEFLKGYEDDWNEIAKDYGYYRVDFECEDYHSHSWLTLKELAEFDTSDYSSIKVKVPKIFYDKFKELGGILPEGMTVEEEYSPDDIVEALRMAFSPEVIFTIRNSGKDVNDALLIKGINELKEIAKKYNVDESDIRIVFAFDN